MMPCRRRRRLPQMLCDRGGRRQARSKEMAPGTCATKPTRIGRAMGPRKRALHDRKQDGFGLDIMSNHIAGFLVSFSIFSFFSNCERFIY